MAETKGREQHEGRSQGADHRPRRIGRVQARDRPLPRREEQAETLHGREGGAHGRGRRQQDQQGRTEGHAPVTQRAGFRSHPLGEDPIEAGQQGIEQQGPETDQKLQSAVPAGRRSRPSEHVVEGEAAERQAHEKGSDHRQHRKVLVSEGNRQGTGPGDLVAETGEARAQQQGIQKRAEPSPAARGGCRRRRRCKSLDCGVRHPGGRRQ